MNQDELFLRRAAFVGCLVTAPGEEARTAVHRDEQATVIVHWPLGH